MRNPTVMANRSHQRTGTLIFYHEVGETASNTLRVHSSGASSSTKSRWLEATETNEAWDACLVGCGRGRACGSSKSGETRDNFDSDR